MLFLCGTTEPYPITLVVTAQIAFHDWRNQAEPSGTMARAQNKFALPYSFMMFSNVHQRYHTIVITRVAVSPERPWADEKLPT